MFYKMSFSSTPDTPKINNLYLQYFIFNKKKQYKFILFTRFALLANNINKFVYFSINIFLIKIFKHDCLNFQKLKKILNFKFLAAKDNFL